MGRSIESVTFIPASGSASTRTLPAPKSFTPTKTWTSCLSAERRGWAGALTWLSPDLSYKVNERLKSSRRPDGLQEQIPWVQKV